MEESNSAFLAMHKKVSLHRKGLLQGSGQSQYGRLQHGFVSDHENF